jgi:hypothetical protein
VRDEDEWLMLNFGGVYALAPEFAIMVGGGAVRKRQIREYLVESEQLWITPTGTYFVSRDGDGDSWTPQAVVGGLFRASSSLAFSFAYETGVSGLTVGLYWAVP